MGEAIGISEVSPDFHDILGPSISGFSNTFHRKSPLPQFHFSFLLDHVPQVSCGWTLTLLWMMNLGLLHLEPSDSLLGATTSLDSPSVERALNHTSWIQA